MDDGSLTNYAQWGNYAQWTGACLTACAIIVALFKETFVRWIRHPRLTARLKAENPDCVKTPISHEGWNGSRYFLRLWIQNDGTERAEKVEVFLKRAWKERGGAFVELPDFTPMSLRWSYGDYHKPTISADGISPAMGKYCDFGAISDPAHPGLRSLSRGTLLSLQFQFLRPAEDWLPPGKYRFEILLVGSNCAPVARLIDLHLTGGWSEDESEMFKNGFLVTVATSSK